MVKMDPKTVINDRPNSGIVKKYKTLYEMCGEMRNDSGLRSFGSQRAVSREIYHYTQYHNIYEEERQKRHYAFGI